MDYLAYSFTTDPENQEILMAFMSDLPFDSMEESDSGFVAYLPEKNWNQALEDAIEANKNLVSFSFEKNIIPAQNWNALWESNFSPIVLDKFVAIRADFHPPNPDVRFDLQIHPKMAFGTGHHETTWMMMESMRDLEWNNATVLDYGCGTGVLAILASKLGAKNIQAVDNEEPAYESTIENCQINQVDNVTAYFGVLESVPPMVYDIILANINRNVILDSLSALYHLLQPDGKLLISGFLIQDAMIMEEATTRLGFTLVKTLQKGQWLAQLLYR